MGFAYGKWKVMGFLATEPSMKPKLRDTCITLKADHSVSIYLLFLVPLVGAKETICLGWV